MPSLDGEDGLDFKNMIFNGNVETYPDWRRRAQALYAATDETKRITVAPRLYGCLTGAAWESIKSVDPESLRSSQGFSTLLSILDVEFEWQPISRLAKDLDDYLGLASRKTGEGITSLIARNRAAMKRFVEAVQKHYEEEAEILNKERKAEYKHAMLEYLADLEAWRERHWDHTLPTEESFEIPRSERSRQTTSVPTAGPAAAAGDGGSTVGPTAAAGDQGPEPEEQQEEPPTTPRPTPPERFVPVNAQKFIWPEIVAGHLFLKKLGLDRSARTSLIRNCGGSYRLTDLERVLKLSEAEYFHRNPQRERALLADGADPWLSSSPSSSPHPPDPVLEYPEDPSVDPEGGFSAAEQWDFDFEDRLLQEGEDLQESEVAMAALNYVQARDQLKQLRKERGFRPRPKGKGKGKGKTKSDGSSSSSAAPSSSPSVARSAPAPAASGFVAVHVEQFDAFSFMALASAPEVPEQALVGFDVEPGFGLVDTGCTLSVIGADSVPAYRQALTKASGGTLAPKRFETLVKYAGLTGQDSATYGLEWPVQFGRLRGTLKTAVLPGCTPLLISNSVLTKMLAVIDHSYPRLWYPAADQWIQLHSGSKGQFKMKLFDFDTGGALPLDAPEEVPPPVVRNKLELNMTQEGLSASTEHPEDSGLEPPLETTMEVDAQKAVGQLARATRGPWAGPESSDLVPRILNPLGVDHSKYLIRATNVAYKPHFYRLPPASSLTELTHRCTVARSSGGRLVLLEPFRPVPSPKQRVPLPHVDGERPSLTVTLFARPRAVRMTDQGSNINMSCRTPAQTEQEQFTEGRHSLLPTSETDGPGIAHDSRGAPSSAAAESPLPDGSPVIATSEAACASMACDPRSQRRSGLLAVPVLPEHDHEGGPPPPEGRHGVVRHRPVPGGAEGTRGPQLPQASPPPADHDDRHRHSALPVAGGVGDSGGPGAAAPPDTRRQERRQGPHQGRPGEGGRVPAGPAVLACSRRVREGPASLSGWPACSCDVDDARDPSRSQGPGKEPSSERVPGQHGELAADSSGEQDPAPGGRGRPPDQREDDRPGDGSRRQGPRGEPAAPAEPDGGRASGLPRDDGSRGDSAASGLDPDGRGDSAASGLKPECRPPPSGEGWYLPEGEWSQLGNGSVKDFELDLEALGLLASSPGIRLVPEEASVSGTCSSSSSVDADLMAVLKPRYGVKRKTLKELVTWLGPQAWKLQHPVRLIEFFGGARHRVSREAESRGHVSIVIGIAHGQDLRGKKAVRLSKALLDYTRPEDILVAWVCTPWSAWSTFNERKGDLKGTATGDQIRERREEGRQFIALFHLLWRRQLAAGRHATGENPFNSLAFLEDSFLSGQFPREAWWAQLDQCQVGLHPPWPGGDQQRHQKRTCFVTSRSSLAHSLSLCCSPECKARHEHVPLAGGWKGRALTSYAEDYPHPLARLLCDAMGIFEEKDAMALPAHEEILDEEDCIKDQVVVDILNSVANGTYQAQDFTSSELDYLEMYSGIRIQQLQADDRMAVRPEAPDGARYRMIFGRINGQWSDLEGSVLLSSRPAAPQEGALPGDRWIAVFGEPLLRVRARGFPQDASEDEAMAWLKKFHIGTHHASPAEMAQAIEDAGGSKALIRMALQYRCPICAIDELPKSHSRSAIPLAARSFNAALVIDVVDIKLERPETPVIQLNVLVCIDAFSSYGMGFILEDLSSATILRHLVDGWFAAFGAPRRLFSDGYASLVSKEWYDTLARWGVLATTSAAHAPWQHGKVEAYNQRIRRFVRAVWRTLGAYPEVLPREALQLAFSGRNELDLTAAGVPPCQAALGYRPRRFFGDEWDEDWRPMSTDPRSLYERDVKVRAAAREAILREQTRSRIDRAVSSKPMALQVFEPGTIVQIYRDIVRQGGRRAGRWLGPGVILGTESAHGGRVPRIVHVAYRNKTWLCAPEQVRPVHVDALTARRTLEAVPELRPRDLGKVHYDRDIRPQTQYFDLADPAGESDAPMGDDMADSDTSSWLGPSASKIPRLDEPAENIDHLFADDDDDEMSPENPERDRDDLSDEEFEKEMQSIYQSLRPEPLAADSAAGSGDPADGAGEEGAYHASHGFFATAKAEDPLDKPAIALSFDVDWDELRSGPRAIEEICETCLVASVAKKRRVEVSFRKLTPKEKIGMRAAKKKEFAQWLTSSVMNMAASHGVPHARVVRCRWVLTFKKADVDPKAPLNEVKDFNVPDDQIDEKFADLGDGRLCKARLVILGYEDPDIGQYATYAPTARRDSKAWVFAIAAHRGWRLSSLDAKAAFLNGRSSARPRPIYLQLPADCEAYLRRVYGSESGPRELYKAAYGLGEAPLAWFELLCDTMIRVGFVQISSDRCMFVLRGVPPTSAKLPKHYPVDYRSLPILGILVVHVDDLLLGGDGPEWDAVLARLKAALPFGSGKTGSFLYVGEMIVQDHSTIRVHQKEHVAAISEVPTKGLQPKQDLTPYQVTEGKGRIGSLLYVATSTRPDLCFEVSHVGSRMNPGAVKQDLLDCNKAVRRARATDEKGLVFRKVAEDWKDVVLCVFSDAGWATRPSKHSQAGGLHFLAHRKLLEGEMSVSCLLDWVSSKITWITGNPYEAEAHACRINAELAEHLQFFHHELTSYEPQSVEEFLLLPPRFRWSAVIVIDNRGLYSQVDCGKLDKRRTIYVMVLYELLHRTGCHLYWVNSGHELADPLTKLPGDAGDTLEALDYALSTGMIRIAYDTESYRKAMQKKAGEVRSIDFQNLNVAQVSNEDFDVAPRGSLKYDRKGTSSTGDVDSSLRAN